MFRRLYEVIRFHFSDHDRFDPEWMNKEKFYE